MQLARHLRMILLACTLSLFFVSLSSSFPIRLSDGQVFVTKRDTPGGLASTGDPIISPLSGTMSSNSSESLPRMESVNLPPMDQTQTILNHGTDGSLDHSLKKIPELRAPPEAPGGKVVSPRKEHILPSATIDNLTTISPLIDTSASNSTTDANTSLTNNQIPMSDKEKDLNVAAVSLVQDSQTSPLAKLNSTAEASFDADSDTLSDSTKDTASLPQVTFPKYGEFQGNVSQSKYHPFLAEEDTLISEEPMREYGPAPYETRYRALDDESNNFDVLKHWGNLAPYYSSSLYPEVQKFKAIPSYCKLKQVHMLHRHGARLPTDVPQESAPQFGHFFTNLTQSNTSLSFDGPLSFMNDWKYNLGSNLLTPAGSQQLYDSGVQSYYRYSALYNSTAQKHKPVVRTTSQSRMLDSATYFNLGFFGKNAADLVDLEVLIESNKFNSTLSSGESCTNANDYHVSESKVQTWLDKYLKDTVDRFQSHVHGFNLTPRLVFGMQSLCAYETYANGRSDFCSLFTKDEWKGFEYALDLHYNWSYGSANPTGRAQGIGWGQELVTRIKVANFTGPITSQNLTVDQDKNLFPTDQRFYFDFSHDSSMISVLTALNFTQFNAELDSEQIDKKRNFVLSHIAPFAARLFFEVLDCHKEGEGQQYIRAILNDALLPLGESQGCPPSALKDGMCPLDKFIDNFEKKAVNAADYQQSCFGDTVESDAKETAIKISEALPF